MEVEWGHFQIHKDWERDEKQRNGYLRKVSICIILKGKRKMIRYIKASVTLRVHLEFGWGMHYSDVISHANSMAGGWFECVPPTLCVGNLILMP